MPDFVTPLEKQRKVYIKPQVEIVELQPKQTVLGGCLTASLDNGNDGLGCGTPYNPKCID